MRRGHWIPVVLVLFLVLWSARTVIGDPTNLMWGDRTDSIHHVWGHWWMAQAGAEGGLTTWVNTPYGEYGSVLGPIGNLLVRPALWLGGAVLAFNLLSLLYVLFDAFAVGLLAAQVTGSRRAAGVAAVVLVVGRPLLVHAHLGNTEGLAIAWVALVAWLGLRWDAGSPWWTGPVVGLLSGIAVVENPYALPVLAVLAPSLALRRLRQGEGALPGILGAVALGLMVPGLRLLQVGSGLGGNLFQTNQMEWAGFHWAVFDPDWYYPAWQMIWPEPRLEWRPHTTDVFRGGGFAYLGLGAIALALVGTVARVRQALPWILVCLVFAWLSLGSRPMGPRGGPGLFLFVDSVISQALPALTQPLRYLPFALGALGVVAALGAQALDRRGWAIPAILLLLAVEGVTVGGPSDEVPTLDLAELECLRVIDGPVHTLLEAKPGALAIGNGRALLAQLVHQQPGTHRGIGGWEQAESEPEESLAERGVEWVLVPDEGVTAISCGGFSALRLEDWLATSDRSLGTSRR